MDKPRNRDVSLYNRYRYFVSDYDLKQYVKTFFLRPAGFIFLEHAQDFLRLQSVAQPGERRYPGAYLGGALCHGSPPPPWIARTANFHTKASKIEACPAFASWAKDLIIQRLCSVRLF